MRPRAAQPNGGKSRTPRSGGRLMVSGDAGSRASATAGKPSVRTLISSTWTTVIGVPRPPRIAMAKSATSPKLAERRNAMNFRMLSVIPRPSRIAAMIVAKSSSVRTRSEASRAAAVPALPIATPTSARRSAGVVDPVSRNRDDLAFLLQRLDEAQLVRRRNTSVDGLIGESERMPDRARRKGMVACQYCDPQAGSSRFRDGARRCLTERVMEAQKSHWDEPSLELLVVRRERVEGPLSDR